MAKAPHEDARHEQPQHEQHERGKSELTDREKELQPHAEMSALDHVNSIKSLTIEYGGGNANLIIEHCNALIAKSGGK